MFAIHRDDVLLMRGSKLLNFARRASLHFWENETSMAILASSN